jgi:hypothetical protein
MAWINADRLLEAIDRLLQTFDGALALVIPPFEFRPPQGGAILTSASSLASSAKRGRVFHKYLIFLTYIGDLAFSNKRAAVH